MRRRRSIAALGAMPTPRNGKAVKITLLAGPARYNIPR